MIREFLVILRLHSWFRIEMNKKNCWTEEMDEILLGNYSNMKYTDIATIISEKFGIQFSSQAISRRAHILLKKTKVIRWTKQMDNFLIKNYVAIGPTDLAPIMSKMFHIKLTVRSLHARARRLDIRTKTGNCPIGTEHDYGNIIRVKVSNLSRKECEKWQDIWVAKHRYVWEQAYGPIPEDHCIIFVDGNSKNCELSNLRCIPLTYKTLMVRHLSNDIFKEGPEMIDAGIAWCDLKTALKEIKEKE